MKSRLLTNPELQRKDGAWTPALHPGEMLREEFMKPLGLSANALAIALRVPVTRISEIVRERRGITADTALRLARYFNMTPEFWMRLQMNYDLESASDAEQAAIHEEIRPRAGFRRRTETAGRDPVQYRRKEDEIVRQRFRQCSGPGMEIEEPADGDNRRSGD